jgi:integrase
MGVKRDSAVRLCVTCGKLKAADRFPPGRRECLTCQRPAVQDRARDRALRRLGLEYLEAYRVLYRAERRAIPDTVPTDRARKRAMGRALRALARQHHPRYAELYQLELEQARSQSHPRRPGRPAGTPDRLTIAPEAAPTWRRDGAGRRQPGHPGKGARQRAKRQAVRERAADLFAQGMRPSLVARQLGVARQTAVSWHARWRSGGSAALRSRGPSRHPAIPDRKLPAIEQALLKGAAAHGFDGDGWTTARVAVVIQRITDVRLGSNAVQRLLRERLGWRFQPAISDGTVVTAAQPLLTPASATDRRHQSQRTRAQYAAIYRRFLAWLADELGRPPTRQDLSADVLVRWIAQRARAGGHGGRGLSSASLRLECTALRQLVRHAGRPELAASLHASRQQAPPPETISPAQYQRLLLEPDPTTPLGVRDRAILRLLGDVGLRPSEVCALEVGDIFWGGDGQEPVELQVAWGQGRVVQLTRQASAALAGWLAHHPAGVPLEGRGRGLPARAPLFVTLRPPKSAGQAMTELGLLYQVLRHAQRAGIPAHLRNPNTLRHYWATQQVVRGITPVELQARGGWRDYRSAQAYFQRPAAAAALAVALDLDRATSPSP